MIKEKFPYEETKIGFRDYRYLLLQLSRHGLAFPTLPPVLPRYLEQENQTRQLPIIRPV